MIHKYILGFVFLLILSFQGLQADSPLTSTDFWSSYEGLPMVSHARESGQIDKKLAHYLAQNNVPIAHKMAVCNALGWNFDGKNNHQLLMDRWGIKPHKKKGMTPKALKRLRPDLQLCIAYLMALDNYNKPEAALPYVEQAAKKMKSSYTAQMIRALVRAQVAFATDWCAVWQEAKAVDENTKLDRDLNQDAMTVILGYMELYKDECKE